MKLICQFWGGKYHAQKHSLDYVVSIADGWNWHASQYVRAELKFKPTVSGYLGPVWDGERYFGVDGKWHLNCDRDRVERNTSVELIGVLRYETQEVYYELSNLLSVPRRHPGKNTVLIVRQTKGDNIMNTYAELRNRHQERVNALPIMWAFSMEQFRKEMERMGVTDKSEIVSIGNGGYMRKEDAPLLDSTFEEIDAEMKAAIAADPDGTGFIKDMFLYELANHEYCFTYDLEPTLDACRLTEDEVLSNPRLMNGLKLAAEEYLRNSDNY